MDEGHCAPAAARRAVLRWSVPGVVLAVELLALSVLVDLPTSGPALHGVRTLRLALPVSLAAAVGGWLISRRSLVAHVRALEAALPPWRPVLPLAVQAACFAATAVYTLEIMGPGAAPLAFGDLLLWTGAVAICALLAIASAAPLRWAARAVIARWRLPLASVAVGFLAWGAAALLEGAWGTLSGRTLHAVAWVLRVFTSDVTLDVADHAVGVRGFEVVIAPVCSGVDGVGLVLVFQGTWMFVSRSRLRLPRALWLLPLGAAAALLANVGRISALVLIGGSGAPDLALGGFHSKLGWLLFVPIALGTIALAERVTWFRSDAPARDDGISHAAAAYVAPLVATLLASLVTNLWASGVFDPWYGLRVAAAALTLAVVRASLPRPSLASVPAVPLALAVAVALLWIAFGGGDGGAALESAVAGLSPIARWAWIAARLAGACLVVPLVEELAFRAFLLPALASGDFEHVSPRLWSWPAVLLSSAAFGAVHGSWLLGTAAGIAFAAARAWRGRLWDAIVAHAVCNAVIAAAVLLGGRWDLWS